MPTAMLEHYPPARTRRPSSRPPPSAATSSSRTRHGSGSRHTSRPDARPYTATVSIASIPIAPDTKVNGMPATAKDIGARHAGEIEYVFGQLDSVPKVTWEAADRRLSDLMMSYWSNFARTGDPNGPDLPKWPRYEKSTGHTVMHLNVESQAKPDASRARYERSMRSHEGGDEVTAPCSSSPSTGSSPPLRCSSASRPRSSWASAPARTRPSSSRPAAPCRGGWPGSRWSRRRSAATRRTSSPTSCGATASRGTGYGGPSC